MNGMTDSQDRGARLLRQPGKARDPAVVAVDELVGVVARGLGFAADHPQVGELQAFADAGQHGLVDGANGQQERRRSGGGVADRHRGDQVEAIADIDQEHRFGDAAVTHRRGAAEQPHGARGHQRVRPRMNSTTAWARETAAIDSSGSDDFWPGCE